MWLEYYKLIRSALTRYESNRISLIEKSPVWRAELYFEIRAKALECAVGKKENAHHKPMHYVLG